MPIPSQDELTPTPPDDLEAPLRSPDTDERGRVSITTGEERRPTNGSSLMRRPQDVPTHRFGSQISRFRDQFPQYDPLTDEQILTRLHERHYSDIDYDVFENRFLEKFGTPQPSFLRQVTRWPKNLGRGVVAGTIGMMDSAYALLGEATGFIEERGTVGNWLRDVQMNWMPPEHVQRAIADDPWVLAQPDWWSHNIGSLVPYLVASLIGGKVGLAAGVATRTSRFGGAVARGTGLRTAAQIGQGTYRGQRLLGAGPRVTKTAASLDIGMGVAMPHALLEGGRGYIEAIEQGRPHEEAAGIAGRLMAQNFGWIAGTSALQAGIITRMARAPLTPAAMQRGVQDGQIQIARMTPGIVLTEGVIESMQELGQEFMQNIALDRPWYEHFPEAGILGFVAGMGFGPGMRAANRLYGQGYMNARADDIIQKFPEAMQQEMGRLIRGEEDVATEPTEMVGRAAEEVAQETAEPEAPPQTRTARESIQNQKAQLDQQIQQQPNNPEILAQRAEQEAFSSLYKDGNIEQAQQLLDRAKELFAQPDTRSQFPNAQQAIDRAGFTIENVREGRIRTPQEGLTAEQAVAQQATRTQPDAADVGIQRYQEMMNFVRRQHEAGLMTDEQLSEVESLLAGLTKPLDFRAWEQYSTRLREGDVRQDITELEQAIEGVHDLKKKVRQVKKQQNLTDRQYRDMLAYVLGRVQSYYADVENTVRTVNDEARKADDLQALEVEGKSYNDLRSALETTFIRDSFKEQLRERGYENVDNMSTDELLQAGVRENIPVLHDVITEAVSETKAQKRLEAMDLRQQVIGRKEQPTISDILGVYNKKPLGGRKAFDAITNLHTDEAAFLKSRLNELGLNADVILYGDNQGVLIYHRGDAGGKRMESYIKRYYTDGTLNLDQIAEMKQKTGVPWNTIQELFGKMADGVRQRVRSQPVQPTEPTVRTEEEVKFDEQLRGLEESDTPILPRTKMVEDETVPGGQREVEIDYDSAAHSVVEDNYSPESVRKATEEIASSFPSRIPTPEVIRAAKNILGDEQFDRNAEQYLNIRKEEEGGTWTQFDEAVEIESYARMVEWANRYVAESRTDPEPEATPPAPAEPEAPKRIEYEGDVKSELSEVFDVIGEPELKRKRKFRIHEQTIHRGQMARVPPTWHDATFRYTAIRSPDGTVTKGHVGSYDTILLQGHAAAEAEGTIQPNSTLYVVDLGPGDVRTVRIYRGSPEGYTIQPETLPETEARRALPEPEAPAEPAVQPEVRTEPEPTPTEPAKPVFEVGREYAIRARKKIPAKQDRVMRQLWEKYDNAFPHERDAIMQEIRQYEEDVGLNREGAYLDPPRWDYVRISKVDGNTIEVTSLRKGYKFKGEGETTQYLRSTLEQDIALDKPVQREPGRPRHIRSVQDSEPISDADKSYVSELENYVPPKHTLRLDDVQADTWTKTRFDAVVDDSLPVADMIEMGYFDAKRIDDTNVWVKKSIKFETEENFKNTFKEPPINYRGWTDEAHQETAETGMRERAKDSMRDAEILDRTEARIMELKDREVLSAEERTELDELRENYRRLATKEGRKMAEDPLAKMIDDMMLGMSARKIKEINPAELKNIALKLGMEESAVEAMSVEDLQAALEGRAGDEGELYFNRFGLPPDMRAMGAAKASEFANEMESFGKRGAKQFGIKDSDVDTMIDTDPTVIQLKARGRFTADDARKIKTKFYQMLAMPQVMARYNPEKFGRLFNTFQRHLEWYQRTRKQLLDENEDVRWMQARPDDVQQRVFEVIDVGSNWIQQSGAEVEIGRLFSTRELSRGMTDDGIMLPHKLSDEEIRFYEGIYKVLEDATEFRLRTMESRGLTREEAMERLPITGYFPAGRKRGKWAVTYKDETSGKADEDGDGYGFEMFEHHQNAKDAYDKLMAEGKIKVDPATKKEKGFHGLSRVRDLPQDWYHRVPNEWDIIALLENQGIHHTDPDVQSTVETILNAIKERTYSGQRKMARGGVGRLITPDNMWSSLIDYVDNSVRSYARTQAKALIEADLHALTKDKDGNHTDTVWQSYATEWLQHAFGPDQLTNSMWAHIRKGAFMYNLAWNASHFVLNLTQTMVATFPFLNEARWGLKARQAGQTFMRAHKAAFNAISFTDEQTGLPYVTESIKQRYPGLQEALGIMIREGTVSPTMSDMMLGLQRGTETAMVFGKKLDMRKIDHSIGMLQVWSERYNRSMSVIAGYMAAQDYVVDNAVNNPDLARTLVEVTGLSDEQMDYIAREIPVTKRTEAVHGVRERMFQDLVTGQADPALVERVRIGFAKHASNTTQFIFGKHNIPRFLWGNKVYQNPLRSAFIFKGFMLNYVGFWANMFQRGRISAQSLTALAAPLLALAGLTGIPFSEDLREAMKSAGIGDFETLVRDVFDNDRYADAVLKGLPAMLPSQMAFDFSRRAGVGNVLPRGTGQALGAMFNMSTGWSGVIQRRPDASGDVSSGIRNAVLDFVGGAPLQVATNQIGPGIARFMAGDYYLGVEQAVPVVARNAMRSLRFTQEGVMTPQGRLRIPAEEFTPADTLKQAFGFKPLNIAKHEDYERAMRYMLMERRDTVSHFNEQIARAAMAGDQKKMENVIKDIMKYNARVKPEHRYYIRRQIPSIKRRMRLGLDDYADIRFAPMQTRPRAIQLRERYLGR